jgi:hypothetical protein
VSEAEQLAWEDRRRSRAAAAAFLAGGFILGGNLLLAAISGTPPRNAPGAVLFVDDNAAVFQAVAVVLGVGAAAIAVPLDFLFRAAKARRPELLSVTRVFAIAGPLVLGVSQIVQQALLNANAATFRQETDLGYTAARDVAEDATYLTVQALQTAGALGLGIAFVLISLNAMKVGLLTRFMGWLGVIIGVLFVVPFGASAFVVRGFWLLAAGVLLSGRWPGGIPPAWRTGRAEPWPTGLELREQRERERAAQRGEAADEAEASGRDPGAGEREPVGARAAEAPRPHPTSRKRKRKRRS